MVLDHCIRYMKIYLRMRKHCNRIKGLYSKHFMTVLLDYTERWYWTILYKIYEILSAHAQTLQHNLKVFTVNISCRFYIVLYFRL